MPSRFHILLVDLFDNEDSKIILSEVENSAEIVLERCAPYVDGSIKDSLIEDIGAYAIEFMIKHAVLSWQLKMAGEAPSIPIVHIVAHGTIDGIYTDTPEPKSITWNELCGLLCAINKILDGNCILCLSACEGWSGIQMNIGMDKISPYHTMVGPVGSYRLADIQSVFCGFYRYMKYNLSDNEHGLTSLVADAVRSANRSCVDIGGDADNRFLLCMRSTDVQNRATLESVFSARNIGNKKEKMIFMYRNIILNRTARRATIRAFSRLFAKIRSGPK